VRVFVCAGRERAASPVVSGTETTSAMKAATDD